MVERKEIGKETTSQDLTDHRALLEQLHTIRTASLEERHGSERDWKAKKNVTEIENHAIRIHWYLISTNKSMTKPKPRTQMYKNMILMLRFLFFIESFCSILAWSLNFICDGVSKFQSELSTFFRFFSVLLTRYIESHQDLHMPSLPNSKAKRQTSTGPKWLWKAKQTSKPEIHRFLQSFERVPKGQVTVKVVCFFLRVDLTHSYAFHSFAYAKSLCLDMLTRCLREVFG